MGDASVAPSATAIPPPPQISKRSPTETDLIRHGSLKKRLSVTGVPIQASPRAPPLSMVVQFAHPWAYRLSWALVVAAHVGVVVAYDHEAYINSYILLGSKTEMAVQLLGLGASIRREIGNALVFSNRVLMAWHIYGAAQAVLSSILYRQFVFRFKWTKHKANKHDSMGERNAAAMTKGKRLRTPLGKRIVQRVWAFYRSTGARGTYFNAAFDVRETVEIVSQTMQAYTISCLITNESVLHFVSLVLVLNCWSTPILRLVFRSDEATKRLLCLAVDAVFDFCCALAIPFLTFSLWEHQVATLDFFDAVWLIRSSTLLQYNLVNTWQGVVTTRLPALGLVLALETMKSLLHQQEQSVSALPRQPSSFALTGPSGVHIPGPATTGSPPAVGGPSIVAVVPKKRSSRVHKLVDLGFFVYGLVVLILYTRAMAEPSIDQDPSSNCLLQLRPWGRRKAQCAVLDVDCTRLDLVGSSVDVASALNAFDPRVIASVTIANCPALEIPPQIQELSRLLHLEIYNSTLVQWGATAALTGDFHPILTGLFLVRVSNLQSGLPQGLLSPRFPPSLSVVQIVGGDLSVVAGSAADEASIRNHWPPRMFVFVVERTPLNAFPTVVLNKTITQMLSFAATSLTSVPAQVFLTAAPSMALLLGGNPIASLPLAAPVYSKTATELARAVVHLESTLVSDLPMWIFELYNSPPSSTTPLVWARGSPLCATAAPPSFMDCKSNASATYFPLADYEKRRAARAGSG